jgi:RimJ/RimL family protein N-acetyltransferase
MRACGTWALLAQVHRIRTVAVAAFKRVVRLQARPFMQREFTLARPAELDSVQTLLVSAAEAPLRYRQRGRLAMVDAATYSAVELLRTGYQVEIRALRPDDRTDLLAAVGRTSGQSLYRRFFALRRRFTEKEIAFFVNVDFVKHVALVAVAEESGRPTIIGGGRYVVVQPGKAEVAFAVVDQYQGQGIGAALLRHLVAIARGAGLTELIAEVLPENEPMLKVFEKSGLRLSTKREPKVIHLTLQLS